MRSLRLDPDLDEKVRLQPRQGVNLSRNSSVRRQQSEPRRRWLVARASASPTWPGWSTVVAVERAGPVAKRSPSRWPGPQGPVTLTDAGPLIAIIDVDEPDHASCVDALDR